jgi:hypothetical protein
LVKVKLRRGGSKGEGTYEGEEAVREGKAGREGRERMVEIKWRRLRSTSALGPSPFDLGGSKTGLSGPDWGAWAVVGWRALPKGGLDGEREGGEGLREV